MKRGRKLDLQQVLDLLLVHLDLHLGRSRERGCTQRSGNSGRGISMRRNEGRVEEGGALLLLHRSCGWRHVRVRMYVRVCWGSTWCRSSNSSISRSLLRNSAFRSSSSFFDISQKLQVTCHPGSAKGEPSGVVKDPGANKGSTCHGCIGTYVFILSRSS